MPHDPTDPTPPFPASFQPEPDANADAKPDGKADLAVRSEWTMVRVQPKGWWRR